MHRQYSTPRVFVDFGRARQFGQELNPLTAAEDATVNFFKEST